MAFSFGGASSSAPAPAFGAAPSPGGGGFSFGGAATPAPGAAPSPGGFSFGGAAPAQGGSTAPAAPLFGAAPPAPGFGATPAAPTAFGATPAPAFGATPAPAFGATPGPAFGATPAPAFGASPAPAFGAPAAPQQQQQQQQQRLSSQTLYQDLPDAYKKAIDQVHECMMKHKRTMAHVKSMGPQGLTATSSSSSSSGDTATKNDSPLGEAVRQLQVQSNRLQVSIQSHETLLATTLQKSEKQVTQAYLYAKWPVEATAVRRGIRLQAPSTTSDEKKEDSAGMAVRALLDKQMAYVDRIEAMPSPYLWEKIAEWQTTVTQLQENLHALKRQAAMADQVLQASSTTPYHILTAQEAAIHRAAAAVEHWHSQMDQIRRLYDSWERDEHVLDQAARQASEKERRLQEQVQLSLLQVAPATRAPATAPGAAPASAGFGGFGTTTPAAPSTGFGGFGSSTTPAPAFGSTPAPSTGFGGFSLSSSSAPGAPPPPPSFGVAPAPGAPAPAFGAAPIPAFGAAPASFSFAPPTTSATAATPKKKSGSSRSGRRR